ncbi:MAG TPA: M23 family metallopeptidase [Anaerolineaceae bacterium]|nr:M23 family metallopeptidase [Anaerolineaceae bacterium]
MKKNFWIILWLVSLLGLLFYQVSINNLTPLNNDQNQAIVLEETSQLEELILTYPTDTIANEELQIDSESLFMTDESIALVFPLPGDPPISLWRPPLYPTPWAISPHDHFYFARPIAADEINWPLANYRYGYFFPDTDIIHTGIDITARRGTPVIAAAPGTVIWVGYGLYYGVYNEEDPYGLAVTLEHDFGYKDKKLLTVYGHLDRIDVEKGQRVETGTQLGIVGNTGNTTGPHLHFEVRYETNSFFRTRNPELWLSPPQGWGVVVGQIKDQYSQYINLKEVYVRNLDTNQTWMVLTYATNNINRDEFYKENLVLSDLPAGNYRISFTLNGDLFTEEIQIHPGAITFFTFIEKFGFSQKFPKLTYPEDWKDSILMDNFYP